jgi:hypothetical protein
MNLTVICVKMTGEISNLSVAVRRPQGRRPVKRLSQLLAVGQAENGRMELK